MDSSGSTLGYTEGGLVRLSAGLGWLRVARWLAYFAGASWVGWGTLGLVVDGRGLLGAYSGYAMGMLRVCYGLYTGCV